jgi:hypothetical protein
LNIHAKIVLKCTPQELAILLPAFDKIGNAFEAVENPSDVGFTSGVLNDIIHSLPKLKESMKELLGTVSLKRAAEGCKDTMWTDPERYPRIADADLVCALLPSHWICLFIIKNTHYRCQAIQSVDIELAEELKASKLFLTFVTPYLMIL